MSTKWALTSGIYAKQQRKFRRWIGIGIGLFCLCGGLLFSVNYNSTAIAQTSPAQVQTSEVDRLTKTCFQLLQEASYARMLATCTEAVDSAKAVGDRKGETYALINLASAHGALGQYSQAIDRAQHAWQLAQDLGEHQAQVYSLINLANAYRLQGQYDQAIEHAEKALQMTQALGDRQSEAYALINLASAYWSLGEPLKTIDYAKQSLQVARELGDHQGEASALINLASAYGARQDYPNAIDYSRQALQLAQTNGNHRGEALALNNLGYAFYGSHQLTEAETYLRQSITVFESLRPTLTDAEKLSLFETLTNPYQTLQGVLVAQGKTAAALEIAERGRARALVDRLAQRSGSANAEAAVATAAPISLAGIRQVAQEQDATLVEYAIAPDEHLYSWVISPTGTVTFRQVDLSSLTSPLGELAPTIDSAVAPGSRHTDTATTSVPADSLQQLYQILIAPIQDLLPSNPNDHIVFVPHGSLFLVPFAALQAPDGTYLIEHHTLRVTPSIQVLQLTHRQQQQAITTALVVGNPTHDLPAAEKEAKTIARRFNTTPLLGRQATKAAVIEQMPKAGLIHLATHAAPNGLDETYGGLIVLASSVKGFSNLTTDDIVDMQLQAELVVLSGCSTGASNIINSDGVVGLARSMMMAGVPSVLTSLWPVGDRPTAALMQDFYHYWQPPTRFMASGVGSLPPWLGLLSAGFAWLSWSFKHRHYRFMALGLLSLTSVLIVSLTLPISPTYPVLDKAQALRQTMLTTLRTHPDPKDWAGFTLLGEAR
ncbi:CHAT domain-containing protein [Nodosilinea sp. LEGE 07088]|uniref:CHAT domain-containing protein n=1 Tax=Nodosilinea sp. LEGE 07088 TaxID=2777968 RepID=UPI00187FE8C9|nr:CHAT domain-containing tetratricopeptide repeat protein [Nodosilinea sp. LEGE 07088]MBE9138588.1 CHAT domain-containing protein [Nodosilinea sp. LEGE 07088]